MFTIDQKTAMINCIFDHCCSAQLVIILGTIGGCETSAAHMVLRPLVHWESSPCLHHLGTLGWYMFEPYWYTGLVRIGIIMVELLVHVWDTSTVQRFTPSIIDDTGTTHSSLSS